MPKKSPAKTEAAANPTREITLRDVGNPDRIRIPIPEDGGFVVLTGANGLGKTTTLEAVQDMVTDRDKKKATVREGAATGEVSGLGVTLRVGRKITRSGELQVESLDGGRLSIADVVSPPYKGLEEADGRRIKALVQLAGVDADPALFRGLHPDWHKLIDEDECNTDDILSLADQIKKTFEVHARDAEGRAQSAETKRLAAEQTAADYDVNVKDESNGDVLQEALNRAVAFSQDLKTKREIYQKESAARVAARNELAAIKNTPAGEKPKTIKELQAEVDQAQKAAEEQLLIVETMQKRLEDEKTILLRAQQCVTMKCQALGDAEAYAEKLAELEEILDQASAVPPSEDEIAEAEKRVVAASEAIARGIRIRAKITCLNHVKTHQKAVEVAMEEALELRTAAAAVDDVLTEQIAKLGSPLRVVESRLKIGRKFYADLSEGERWRVATEIAIKAVGPRGLLTIPQEAWQGIQPSVRLELNAMLKETGVVILTAQCSDDESIQVIWIDKDSYTVKLVN